ncbi:5-methyltetrahydrofolate--homocysteine methyltransferase [Desulfitobacterium sp. LBE]|nr:MULTISPECIES: methyltetrahydrofolate cobalamin methyltransferase [Desulfitobacterium]WPA93992.1 corrinoid/iron-sulfur protein methyltransferase [uncultured organism]ACL22613.1 dihydropteroate synthase DHPS [Desulfitobacterium hafniense DCB-2]KTE93725.1 methyltetrahydrofolate--corrinoid methyltransferase [Desulfitobacterium hafniense]MEA5022171.1 methyltetrahydrofolate cobalamin methyltransferase [Desulfitobacterium hafniense]TWH59503.1 5-methyltetrahydrofolate--homocysteine methyltransferas
MILIGEKINGAIPSVAKAIAAKDADFIRNLAKVQSEAGVNFLDVCASVDNDIELETLKWLIDLVQEVSDIPIAIDSPNANVIAEAIKFCNKPGLINSVSMEGDKVEVIFPIIADTKWECVALLCDDTGIPQDTEKRLEVFGTLMAKAKQYNIAPSRLHIDPLVQMLCTSEDGILAIMEVIKEIKAQYPKIHITGGASNISFNLPIRRLVNQAFIVLAMGAGMDSAIVDPTKQDLMGMIFATEALLGQDEYCMEYIGAYREGKFGQK